MPSRFLNNIRINEQYTLPVNDGSAGQAIVTDGSGNLSFGSAVASSAESAESIHITVKNTSGSQITKGTPVYITGETGNSGKIEVAPADASDSAKMPAVGILESTLNNNAEGFCVQGGLLGGLSTATIDGTTTTVNDTVYVKSGGGLTMTKPTGSGNLIQNIAKVARAHASNGSLVVSSILRTNDVPNLPTGKIWVGDGNTTVSTVVHLDETNGRMGIGTTSPSAKLEIQDGSIKLNSTSSYPGTNSIIATWNGSTSPPMGYIGWYENPGFVGSEWSHYDQTSPYTQARIRLIGDASSGGMFVNLNGSDVFTIQTSSGNVGIGTTSPSQKLEVAGKLLVDNGDLGSVAGDTIYHAEITGTRHHLDFKEVRTANGSDWPNTTYKLQMRVDSTNHQSIDFVSDANAQEHIDIYTGNQVFNTRFDANGNVGIGTTSPGGKLHVKTGTAGTYNPNANHDDITIEGSGNVGLQLFSPNSTYQYVAFGDPDSLNAGYIRYHHGSNTMVLRTNGQDRVNINSSGNVGIGTTSPSQKLDVDGDATFTGRIYANTGGLANVGVLGKATADGWAARYDSNNTNYSGFYFDNNNHNIIVGRVAGGTITNYIAASGSSYLNGGNVGIGVTAPSTKLEVVDTFSVQRTSTDSEGFYVTVSGADANGIVETFYQEDSASRYGIRKRYDGSTNLYQEFIHDNSTTGTEVYRVDRGTKNTSIANGNVGIGTTDPSTKLDVVASTTGKTWADYAGTVGTFERNGDSNINIVSSNTGVGGVWFGDTDSMVRGRIRYEHASDKMELWTNNSEKVSITSAGDVGIGATNPSEKLEVNGTIKATATTDAYKGYIKQNVVSYGFERNESVNYYFFPYNTTSLTNLAQAYNRMVAAYSGRVKKVHIKHAGGSTPTATAVNFKKHTNGTTSSTVYAATVANGASFGMSAYYEFANSDFTFNAGDLIGLLYQTTDAFGTALKTMGGVAVTITLEYNIT